MVALLKNDVNLGLAEFGHPNLIEGLKMSLKSHCLIRGHECVGRVLASAMKSMGHGHAMHKIALILIKSLKSIYN